MFVSTSPKLKRRYINKVNHDVLKYKEVFDNMTVVLNNPQNDTVIRKKSLQKKCVYRRQFCFSELLVLSVADLTLGHSDLIFVNPAVKVNETYVVW